MRRVIFTLVLAPALAGCSTFPELEQTASARARMAPYPQILPMEELLPPDRGGRPDGRATPADERAGSRLAPGALPARLAGLQRRARLLRARPVIDSASRARMLAALARHR